MINIIQVGQLIAVNLNQHHKTIATRLLQNVIKRYQLIAIGNKTLQCLGTIRVGL